MHFSCVTAEKAENGKNERGRHEGGEGAPRFLQPVEHRECVAHLQHYVHHPNTWDVVPWTLNDDVISFASKRPRKKILSPPPRPRPFVVHMYNIGFWSPVLASARRAAANIDGNGSLRGVQMTKKLDASPPSFGCSPSLPHLARPRRGGLRLPREQLQQQPPLRSLVAV